MWWLAAWAACGTSSPHSGLDVDDPQACVECHQPLVEEWSQAMHAQAHASKDPIFAGLKEMRTKKQGAEVTAKCARCHSPRSPDDDTTPAALAGVSCAACHVKADGSMGLVAEGDALCATCHGALSTPSGLAACTTGPEHAEAGPSGAPCQSCHMPAVDGPATEGQQDATHASHAFLGPHRAWQHDDRAFLAGGVGLSIAFQGDQVVTKLGNRSGHGFPTGFPGREAVLSITIVDGSGQELHTESHRLGKTYTDDEGNPKPAAFATKLAEDTRLKPDETRTWELAVPEGAVHADARVSYRLLPEKLAKAIGVAGEPVAEPVWIARERASR